MIVRQNLKLLYISLTLILLSACTTAPIYNVDKEPVGTKDSKALTLKQVKSAIVQVAVKLGWNVKDKGNEHLVATLDARGHIAVVDIRYSTKSYSIHYKNSLKLDYDGKNIHRKYNKWVKNLQRRIDQRLKVEAITG